MESEKVLSLFNDYVKLEGFLKDRARKGDADIVDAGEGFNMQSCDELKACNSINELHYDTWIQENYRNPVHRQLSIINRDKFWKHFVEYLNKNQFEILEFIQEKIKEDIKGQEKYIREDANTLRYLLEKFC